MINLRIFYTFLTIFIFGSFYSQNTKKVDSLLSLVQNSDAYSKYSEKELMKICSDAYRLSKSIKYEEGTLNAIQKILAIKVNTINTENFESYLSEGIAIAEKKNQISIETRLLMYKSWYFTKLGFYDKSKNALQQALTLTKKIDDAEDRIARTSRIYSYYTTLMDVSKAPTDSLIYYALKSYEASKSIPKENPQRQQDLAEKEITLAGIYLDNGDLEKGEDFLKEFRKTVGTKSDPFFEVQYLKLSGKLAQKKNDYAQAVKYYEEAATLAKKYEIGQLRELYSLLADNYLKLKDYKNSSLYAQEFKKISDSIDAVQVKAYDTVSKLDAKKNKASNSYLIPILLLTGIAGILIFLFRKRRQANNIPDYDLATSQEVVSSKKIVNTEEINELVNLAKSDEQSFYLKFEEIYPDFNKCLQPFQLTSLDQKFCCYLRLKFDTKQIALFTNTSVKSVESRKYRLRKKMSIPSDEDIYSFIDKISR